MIQTQAIVIQRETIAPAWWRLIISAPDLSPPLLPGQFLMLRCGDLFSSYLRRPIFPQPLDNARLGLFLRPGADPGLSWLSARNAGDGLDIIGPLGTGFSLPDMARNLLLISDSQQITPLLGQMERAISAGLSITLALGASRAAMLYPTGQLPPQVELQVATLDGSRGHHGSITDLLPDLLRWADSVCAVGSAALYGALKAQTASVRFTAQGGFLQGLLGASGLFACGLGACSGCAVETSAGARFICTDGPVFDLAGLTFEGAQP